MAKIRKGQYIEALAKYYGKHPKQLRKDLIMVKKMRTLKKVAVAKLMKRVM